MPLDTPLVQLQHVLSARAQAWFRYRIEALPDPLPADEATVALLCHSAVLARACSQVRGSRVPLEAFIAKRLTPTVLAAAMTGATDADTRAMIALVAQGYDDAPEPTDLALRLALADMQDGALISQAETLLTTPIPSEVLTPTHVDLFARVLMQLYQYGAHRPRFSAARIYGDIFANCLRFADWAERGGHLTALSQMCVCLRLIDRDHDLAEPMARLIACQRPDGSYPVRLGYGTDDQAIAQAWYPTLMMILTLQITSLRPGQQMMPAPAGLRVA